MSKNNFIDRRESMVNHQIRDRGIRSTVVLEAMRRVAREAFVPDHLRELAYNDSALPIAAEQTISQPMIVAMMIEALSLKGGERVLDVGTGLGYAAAVLACIADKVYSIERIEELAIDAKKTLLAEGFNNIELRLGDGSLGWPEAAPFDAINVAAGAPVVPAALKSQLAIGGRLVLPVGSNEAGQQLLRITRTSENTFETEKLADVLFVPLVGEAGWKETKPQPERNANFKEMNADDQRLVDRIAQVSEPFDTVDDLPLESLLKRIGDSRLVLLGEASHGTSEFYRARHCITRALIEEKGFDFVVIEGDWPDVSRIDQYVRHAEQPTSGWTAFSRFPNWMWRNEDVREFVDWLHEHNTSKKPHERVAMHGFDLYSLYQSIDAVVEYLDSIDPQMAAYARKRYDCLTPYKPEPSNYSNWVGSHDFIECNTPVGEVLNALLERKLKYELQGRDRFLEAVQNARLVVSAEAYYRLMHDRKFNSWNQRDTYMFETLEALLDHYGEGSRGIVWAHNSHLGDARATESVRHGELNVGQLCRERFGAAAYLIGFGTNSGTVAAASGWDRPMEVKTDRKSVV